MILESLILNKQLILTKDYIVPYGTRTFDLKLNNALLYSKCIVRYLNT